MLLELSYLDFIDTVITKKDLHYQHTLSEQGTDKYYILFACDEGVEYVSKINNIDDSADVSDYETNYKDSANERLADEEKVTSLKREITPDGVGSNYQFESIDIAISASVGWYEKSFSFPMNIAIFGGSCLLDAEHLGDKLEVLILDSTIVGNITQDIVVSSNEIYVSASVIANIKMGYVVTLYDGVNTNVLGRVKSIDIENNKITMEFSTTDSFSAFTPTYVKMSVYLARYCYLHGVGEMRMGGKVGSSLVPANTSMKLRYYNSNAVAKKFSFIFEYFY